MVIGGAATPPSEAQFRAAGSDVLKVYVYHGTARRADPTYLAQFDIVITTFSTLQTEYSRRLRSQPPTVRRVRQPRRLLLMMMEAMTRSLRLTR